MAGTLFGLPLSQQLSTAGVPLSGCKLTIYAANTTTLATVYSDFSLLTETSNPLVADSSGRLPQFWLTDGYYRARLTTSAGVEVFDELSLQSLGPSFGSSGGSPTVDATTIAETGDFKWRPVTGTVTGWVRANGRTVGNAASSGSERASADTEDLFTYLWTNFTNADCPVSTGRGISAAADFAANKNIGTVDMRGRAPFGLDTMGNTAASVLVVGTPTVANSVIGAEKTTLALVNLPSTTLSLASVTVTPSLASVVTGGSTAADNTHTGAGNFVQSLSSTALTCAVGGSLPLGGSGTPVATVSPGRLGTWYIKL
jgi:hypothetical protein